MGCSASRFHIKNRINNELALSATSRNIATSTLSMKSPSAALKVPVPATTVTTVPAAITANSLSHNSISKVRPTSDLVVTEEITPPLDISQPLILKGKEHLCRNYDLPILLSIMPTHARDVVIDINTAVVTEVLVEEIHRDNLTVEILSSANKQVSNVFVDTIAEENVINAVVTEAPFNTEMHDNLTVEILSLANKQTSNVFVDSLDVNVIVEKKVLNTFISDSMSVPMTFDFINVPSREFFLAVAESPPTAVTLEPLIDKPADKGSAPRSVWAEILAEKMRMKLLIEEEKRQAKIRLAKRLAEEEEEEEDIPQVAPQNLSDTALVALENETISQRKEGCSCLYGNPCVDEYVCLDWDNRLAVAAANGKKK